VVHRCTTSTRSGDAAPGPLGGGGSGGVPVHYDLRAHGEGTPRQAPPSSRTSARRLDPCRMKGPRRYPSPRHPKTLNPRFLSQTATFAVASNVCQALPDVQPVTSTVLPARLGSAAAKAGNRLEAIAGVLYRFLPFILEMKPPIAVGSLCSYGTAAQATTAIEIRLPRLGPAGCRRACFPVRRVLVLRERCDKAHETFEVPTRTVGNRR